MGIPECDINLSVAFPFFFFFLLLFFVLVSSARAKIVARIENTFVLP